RRMAWIEWDRPQQPWTETRLGLAENGRTRCLAGAGGGESIQQPRFDPAGLDATEQQPSLSQRQVAESAKLPGRASVVGIG
ncbi:hypothetical protein ACV331_35755, partial [Pseudomonas aeruginosa]